MNKKAHDKQEHEHDKHDTDKHDKQEHEHDKHDTDKHDTDKHETKHDKHDTDHADEVPAIMAQVVETFHIQSIAKKTREARSPQLTTKNFAIATMCIKSGDKVEERAFPGEKIYLVARGEGTITMGTTTASLDKGEMIVIPAGQAHTLHADDDDDFKLIAIESVHTDLHPVPLVSAPARQTTQPKAGEPKAGESKAKASVMAQ